MLEFVDGRPQFTKVFARPAIVVEDDVSLNGARHAIHDAHLGCFVAHSIASQVIAETILSLRVKGR